MSLWLIIIGMMVVTYGVRLSVITLLEGKTMPEGVNRALRYVPPVALAAIVFPEVLMPAGTLDISPMNKRLLAGIAAAVVARLTRNTILSIAVGMVMLWLLQALLP